MFLAANMIDAARSGAAVSVLAEMTRGWTLVKLSPRGSTPEVVVEGVACFAVAPGGELLYADGSAIHRRSESGATECVCSARDVVACVAL
jgi:hypothetical protein